jgi:hypothetical protein
MTTTLAPPRASLRVLLAAVSLVFIFICTVVPVSSDGAWWEYAAYGLFLSIMLALAGGAGTARIDASLDSLILKNLFVTERIPRSFISEVDGINGILIIDRAGGAHDTVGYGSSLLEGVFPSKAYARAERNIRNWIDARDSGGTARGSQSQLRRYWVRAFPVIVIAGQLYALVLNLLTPALRPFLL